jgi:bifunctional non-homologous end joining protein LigD
VSVKKYTKKRKFDKTPEPQQSKDNLVPGFTFYVQKHDASHLHYDFRLELEGVLKSWAIPKGPSLDPDEKRLALEVEDHPLDYGVFEGVIPEGNYGAGTVLLWDKGVFSYAGSRKRSKVSENEFLKAYDKGDIKLQLYGERLKGEFALVRIREKKGKKSAQWLLVKKKDQFANSKKDILDQDTSVISERDLSEIEDDPKMSSVKLVKKAIKIEDYIKSDIPSSPEPMMAYWEKEIFSDQKWLYEIKFDGYRAVSTIDADGNIEIYSRNGKSFNKDFEPIYKDLAKLRPNIVVDGEIVVLDKNGRSSFSKIQQYKKKQEGELYYYIFDLLYCDGYDLTKAPLEDRKYLLQELLKESPETIRYSEHVVGKGQYLYDKSKEQKWEGVIAKKMDSAYQYGKRSHSWLKIKNVLQQEVIIIGFTKPHGKRKYLGSLQLAVYDENNELISIGGVGTGFSEDTLESLYKKLKPLIQKDSPLEDDIETDREIQFVKPELVCEIKFQEWTNSNKVRQATFLGLRTDKSPKDVVKEEPKKSTKNNSKRNSDSRDTAERPSGYIKKHKSENREIQKGIIDNDGISSSGKYEKEVEEVKLSFTNLNKVFWPDEEIKKKDLINYYSKISDYILPYLKGRPQSLKRNPDGVKGKGFFQKNMPKSIPGWLKTEKIDSESKKESINYLICDDRATLLYMANWGCIEINPWFSRVNDLDKPTYGIIDLDPNETDFDKVITVALKVKEVLDIASIKGFPKTSGASGIHIYIPLNGQYGFEQSKSFIEILVRYVNYLDPENTSLERKPSKRKGKVYLDYLQNRRAQTVASPYCVRPEPNATVSTPLFWEELKVGKLSPSMFTISTIIKRLDKIGDIFRPVIHERTDIEKALSKLKKHFDDTK